MPALLALLLSISSLTYRLAPAGTQLHIRLTSTVGSYASRAGSPVRAVLIAPVVVGDETVLAAGSTVSGRVKTVRRVGLGIRHETAGLDLEFTRLTTPQGESIPIAVRVAEVDNGRERVTRNGYIHGVRATDSLCYRVAGYIRIMVRWEVHVEITEWAIKSLIGQLPEPEIYYPAGVELTLVLTEHVLVSVPIDAEPATRQLTDAERADLDPLIATMPARTYDPDSRRPSDLTNVVLIGSRDQIVAAFSAAGWTQANPASLRWRIKWIRAIAERRGDLAGPMSALLLDGAEPDMAWEKGLNDVSKRHHIRVWSAGTWNSQALWMGAATRDVDFAYMRPGQKLSHKIEANIDLERDKILYDLAFTSCANVVDWAARPEVPEYTRNGTGDPIATDTRAAIIGLVDCPAPRLSLETLDTEVLPRHGSLLQRFARREILSARNDALRTNPYWRAFEGGRYLVSSMIKRRRQVPVPEPVASRSTALISTNSAVLQGHR
ncbi:MAG TPA: LssY C-terminal domain-containing protein [Bryobacteraceae bacterium]|nr:LssY C-terminal domain-containing protein [Bryobacteraceae bacterium]